MYPLKRDLPCACTHSRNMTFPKSNVKYKHNLPCEVRASSGRRPNAGESRSDVVLHLRHRGARGGEDTFAFWRQCQRRKVSSNLALRAETPLTCVRQEENASALEGTGCWEVKQGQPSPTGTSGVLRNRTSLLSVLYCILWRSGPTAGIVAKS